MQFPRQRADDEDFLWMWNTTVDKMNAYFRSEEDDYRRIALLRRQYRSMAVPKQERVEGEEDDAEEVIDLMLDDMDEFDEALSSEAPSSQEKPPCSKGPHSLEEPVSSEDLVFPEVRAPPAEMTPLKQLVFTPVESPSAYVTSPPEESSSSDASSRSSSGVSSHESASCSRKREREDDSDDIIPTKRSKTLSEAGHSEPVEQVSREVQPSNNQNAAEEERESTDEQPGTSRDINNDWLLNIDSSLFDPYNDPSLPDPYDDPSLGEMLGFVDSF